MTKKGVQTLVVIVMHLIGCYMLNAHGLMSYHIVIFESLTLQRWCTMELGYVNGYVVDLMLSAMVIWLAHTLN